MEIKIIKSKIDDSLIVWNPFRGTYMKLMSTVPHLIECQVKAQISPILEIKLFLIFDLYETEIGQDSTRTIIERRDEFPFRLKYEIGTPKNHIDDLLPEYFEKFWNDYNMRDLNLIDKK